VSVPTTSNDLTSKGGTLGVQFFSGGSLIALVPSDLERPHLARWHIWGGAYFCGSATPHPKGWGATRSPKIFGTPAYAHTVWPRGNKFGVVTHVRKQLVSRGSPTPHLKGAGPSVTKIFWAPYLPNTVWSDRI